jgi:hypothetical protein
MFPLAQCEPAMQGPGMPTPNFIVRLSPQTRERLASMGRIYGAPTVSAFAREVLEVAASGDPERVMGFHRRLITAAGEQLVLKLGATIDQAKNEVRSLGKRTSQPKRKVNR